MSPGLRCYGGLALALVGQLFFAACTEQEIYALLQGESAIATSLEISKYAPGAHAYGAAGGQLSPAKVNQVQWLAWPQEYNDVVGALGYPRHRTETADYYQISGSQKWLKINYSGRSATSYEILDSL
jgi:hypothetical protein